MTTLRPLGPSVAFTASAMMLTPLSRDALASSSNLSCFGIGRFPPGKSGLFENGEDVLLAQDQILLVVDLHLGAGVLAEQDPIAGLHVERNPLTILTDLAIADGDD